YGMIKMPLVFGDGSVLPKGAWTDAFARPDGWNRMPVLLGTNRDEAKLFLFLDPRFTWKLFGAVPRMRDEQAYQAASDVWSRLWRSWAIDGTAQAMLHSGEAQVFSYRFDWDREPTKFGSDFSKLLGAAHGIEVPFVHGHFESSWSLFMTEESAP